MTDRPTYERHKVVHIAYQTLNRGGCLIYSNGAADAEDTASLLFDLRPELTVDSEVEELIDLVKKTIHAQYVLAKVLSKGIAFHYGNMPLLIRNEIERLFSVGKIEYLICTSTFPSAYTGMEDMVNSITVDKTAVTICFPFLFIVLIPPFSIWIFCSQITLSTLFYIIPFSV